MGRVPGIGLGSCYASQLGTTCQKEQQADFEVPARGIALTLSYSSCLRFTSWKNNTMRASTIFLGPVLRCTERVPALLRSRLQQDSGTETPCPHAWVTDGLAFG